MASGDARVTNCSPLDVLHQNKIHAFTNLYNVHTFALSRCGAELKPVSESKINRVVCHTILFQNYVTPEAILLRDQQTGA